MWRSTRGSAPQQPFPIGVGDLGLTTCKEFEPFLAADAFDIAQPDLTMFGGFTEALRLVQMLEGTGRRIVPHAYNTDITIAANLHFLATQQEVGLVEYSTSPSRLRQGLVRGLPPVGEDGMIPVPDRPWARRDLERRRGRGIRDQSRR